MSRPVSVKRVAQKAKAEDRAARKSQPKTQDSFQNFAAKMGIGTDNLTSGSTYGFNPITRNRTLLEWIHRGSWLGGIAVDIIGDDMTKRGVDFVGEIDPDDQDHLERAAETWDVWGKIRNAVCWSRLYGGAIAVMLIDGQNPSTPLRVDTIGKKAFKGLHVFDRWGVEPSLSELETENGPALGLPRYYTVRTDSAALRNAKIHHSRCLRLVGVELPYWQSVMENLWGISIFERLYDRMVAFDSATQGASQLVYKSYLRTYAIKNLREVIGAGGAAELALIKYVKFMAMFQSIEGVTLMDLDDRMEEKVGAGTGARGLADLLLKFGEQLSGALQIPLVRLFGQAPTGLNSSGESELRTYYDGINMQQNRTLRNPVTTMYQVLAKSEGIKLTEGFGVEFRPLWIMNDMERAQIAGAVAQAVATADQTGLLPKRVGMEELKQSSRVTGIFTNITDEDIKDAELAPPPGAAEALALEGQQLGMEQTRQGMERGEEEAPRNVAGGGAKRTRDRRRALDSILGDRQVMGFSVVVEHERGDMRYGNRLPAAYGYIRKTGSAEGADQMDCFVGPELDKFIFVVDSYEPVSGKFDEHKVMMGYASAQAALNDFRAYYSGFGPPRRVGRAEVISPEDLKVWLVTGDLSKPYSEPTSVGYVAVSRSPESRCAACKFYEAGICSNPAVQLDPAVPEMFDGMKMVHASGWCEEFSPVMVTA